MEIGFSVPDPKGALEAQPHLIVTRDVWLDRLLYVHSYPKLRESLPV
jgi:hypothetical protein